MVKKTERMIKKKSPKFEITERSDYNVVYASGVFGGLDPNDGRIIFFLDRIRPKMRKEPGGAMDLEKINRELQVEIHLPPPQFASVARWMMAHVERFEKKMKSGKHQDKASEMGGASYIG